MKNKIVEHRKHIEREARKHYRETRSGVLTDGQRARYNDYDRQVFRAELHRLIMAKSKRRDMWSRVALGLLIFFAVVAAGAVIEGIKAALQ